MIYFFHHYELPVILQQAHTQDLLMRNQEGGGPPLIVAYEQGGPGAIAINRRVNLNRGAATNNNNNTANNNNAANVNINRRMTGFNFGPFRFRLGVVLTTHQRNEAGGNQQQPDSPPQNHGHSHGHSHGSPQNNHGHSHGSPQNNHGHSHGHSGGNSPQNNHGHSHAPSHGHQHMHVNQHGHQHLHSHSHTHSHSSNVEESINDNTTQEVENSRQNEQQNETSGGLDASQNAGAESTAINSPEVLLNSPTAKTENPTPSSDDLLTTSSEPCRNPKESNAKVSMLVTDCNKEELSAAEAGISCSEKTLDKCDISNVSSAKLDNITTNNDNASQDLNETPQDISIENSLANNDVKLDEIRDDLREISAALKSTLPKDNDSEKSDS